MCHEKRGDAIDYAKWAKGLDFPAAINWLTGQSCIKSSPALPYPCAPSLCSTSRDEPPSFAWQSAMQVFIARCQNALIKNKSALDYLHLKRGLTDETIAAFKLGFNPQNSYITTSTGARLFCARGIVIPCFVDAQLWYVQIRRPEGEIGKAKGNNKYAKVSGSRKAFFNTASLANSHTVFVVGGEFDAMLGQQFAPPGMAILTLGSESNTPTPFWVEKISRFGRIVISMDNDSVGDTANQKWKEVFPSARVCSVPDGKDMTDFWKRGGNARKFLYDFGCDPSARWKSN